MKTLVTGGTGFIGSHLVERLLEQGRGVRVLALKDLLDLQEKENEKIIREKGAEIVYGDVRESESLKPAFKNVDTVFHLAAISRPMNIPTKQYYSVNEQGTINVLQEAEKAGVKKFVHTSTVSVLGLSPDGHALKEDEYQDLDGFHYGVSKKRGEEAALRYYREKNLPVVVIRPSLVYGPRCNVRLIMFKFTKMRLFPLFNNGEAKMEFAYVDNVVQALMLAEKNEDAVGEVYNITDGQSYRIRRVLNTIAEAVDSRPPVIRLPYWAGKMAGYGMEFISSVLGIYPPFSSTAADWMSRSLNVYDCSKAKRELGYEPEVSLEEGVRRTAEWYGKKGML